MIPPLRYTWQLFGALERGGAWWNDLSSLNATLEGCMPPKPGVEYGATLIQPPQPPPFIPRLKFRPPLGGDAISRQQISPAA